MLSVTLRRFCLLAAPVVLLFVILQRDLVLRVFPLGLEVSSFWTLSGSGDRMLSQITFTSIKGYFLQDDSETDPTKFDYVCAL